MPEFFALNSSLGPKGKTDSFKLPQIDARTYRGLNPAPSNKSTAHGSFLPSLYNEKAKVTISDIASAVVVHVWYSGGRIKLGSLKDA